MADQPVADLVAELNRHMAESVHLLSLMVKPMVDFLQQLQADGRVTEEEMRGVCRAMDREAARFRDPSRRRARRTPIRQPGQQRPARDR